MENVVELHLHDHFSTLDGLNTPSEYMERASELGMTHLAQTNHGTLGGHRQFQKAAKDAGIVPILGVEAYVSPTDRFDKRAKAKREDGTDVYNHIILLAQNEVGLKTLYSLNEKAWSEGFYHKPRIDLDLLEDENEGLIVLSGCLNGLICKQIERGDDFQARTMARRLKSFLGDRFFIEVQGHNPADMNHALLEIADSEKIRPVVTSDCHYARKEDLWVEEAMLILSTNPKFIRDVDLSRSQKMDFIDRYNYLYPDRKMSFQEYEVFLRSAQEHRGALESQGIYRTDVITNTQEIAHRIDGYPFHQGLDLLPTPQAGDQDEILERRAHEGLNERGLAGIPEYEQRLKEELDIIKGKNFSTYFLIVRNLIAWAKSKGILVGPGRGSAAGSLVCYSLGITEVDPIKYGLLFFRFINPDRNDFPDIDTDFQDTRRGEIKDYLAKRYKHVASIATFGEFADKGVVRDAARVFKIPLAEVNKALKLVETWEEFEESETTSEFRRKYPEVRKLASRLRGRIRGSGVHAAGVVVSKEPIRNYAPIETASDPSDKSAPRMPLVAMDMDEVADIGMIKLDILGLKTLSVIDDCLRNIKKRHKKDIFLTDLDLNDPAIYRDLSMGYTKGVFQAEAVPYTALLVKMGVNNFNELAASTALVRPGAMNTIGPSYVARKNGEEQVRYAHDLMIPFTEETYGVIVYQEQVMLAMTELAGMKMSDADKVRKIIGKKRDVAEFEQFKSQFVEGASRHVDEKVAEKLWHDFEAHAGYSFNKSHAVAYSMLTYWTAWLKHYYPIEFMHSVLTNANKSSGADKKDRITDYLIETKRLGIQVMLPHVTRSEVDFSTGDNHIRFGLSSIKYISDKTAKRLISIRPVNSYADLEKKVGETQGLTKRALFAMNAVGAAAFEDNPKTGTERDNFYEFLGIPSFEIKELEPRVKFKFRTLDEYEESGVFPILGMARKIKRGDGWARVEFVDDTGSAGIFASDDIPIETGNMYAVLVADNRIVRYITVNELTDGGRENAFVDYLHYSPNDQRIPDGSFRVIAFRTYVTKAKKRMAYTVVHDDHNRLHHVMAFPTMYMRAYSRMLDGAIIEAEIHETESGSLFFRTIN